MQIVLAATLVVRVLGLATVTDQVPNDCGVHVIVPRVKYHAHPGVKTPPQVEDHTAILVVPKENYDTTSSWIMVTLPAFPNYVYTKLNGDQLRMLTDATNPAPSLQGLRLPSLQGCCKVSVPSAKLRSTFQAPYTGAAAVLDVAGGQISACRAPARGTEYRYDTEILLNHNGVARISGDTMKVSKEVRLKNLPVATRGVVYIANLPTCFISGTCPTTKATTAPDGRAHLHAYYAMLQGDTSKCQGSLKNCMTGSTPGDCTTPMIRDAGGVGGKQAFTFECSNTKFP
ncbi:MAG TPA: hypothetical protein VEK57_22290 [Thermoanaerobaculia bacterium]|nr:hypothetical protein [Thermoanaerobaculia bacterium]